MTNSSKSLPKQDSKSLSSPAADTPASEANKTVTKGAAQPVFKSVSPFELYYQLTFMSAMASAGLTRSRMFLVAATTSSPAATYFAAINTLVTEFRYDYPEACRRIGSQAKSENMKTFLLRLSDTLRSGESIPDYLAREAGVQADDYQNGYERSIESLKQWTDAFSSIVISVALIVIIQVITSMVYSTDLTTMGGLILTGLVMACFGAWIILRSVPKEQMVGSPTKGSVEQRRAWNLLRMVVPAIVVVAVLLYVIGVDLGYILIAAGIALFPVGLIAARSDGKIQKKDVEFATFLRSTGGMATSSGTTLKQALTKIDLTSFPTLEDDINRLSKRLQALVEPEICWQKFGQETGSKLISDVIDIFYGAVKMGGEPERVGYLCSLFTAKAVQLRAKRRLVSGTFTGLTTVMQGVVAGLMVFVLSIVQNFAALIATLLPADTDALSNQASMSLGMAQFTASDLQFLASITVFMILALALVSAAAIIFCSGGYKVKVAMYAGLLISLSGIALVLVPPAVANMLKQ
ncbi:MAG: type II secretion system F family protein [Anaerolineae bacterium]|nr:type II secretion system F family protein [Anaerolineae bacterium]